MGLGFRVQGLVRVQGLRGRSIDLEVVIVGAVVVKVVAVGRLVQRSSIPFKRRNIPEAISTWDSWYQVCGAFLT